MKSILHVDIVCTVFRWYCAQRAYRVERRPHLPWKPELCSSSLAVVTSASFFQMPSRLGRPKISNLLPYRKPCWNGGHVYFVLLAEPDLAPVFVRHDKRDGLPHPSFTNKKLLFFSLSSLVHDNSLEFKQFSSLPFFTFFLERFCSCYGHLCQNDSLFVPQLLGGWSSFGRSHEHQMVLVFLFVLFFSWEDLVNARARMCACACVCVRAHMNVVDACACM